VAAPSQVRIKAFSVRAFARGGAVMLTLCFGHRGAMEKNISRPNRGFGAVANGCLQGLCPNYRGSMAPVLSLSRPPWSKFPYSYGFQFPSNSYVIGRGTRFKSTITLSVILTITLHDRKYLTGDFCQNYKGIFSPILRCLKIITRFISFSAPCLMYGLVIFANVMIVYLLEHVETLELMMMIMIKIIMILWI